MRVLLVDESKTVRNIQKYVLAALGATHFAEAGDGQDGLSQLEAFNPDLILVEWNLPHLSGLEFVRRCRAWGRRTPIVMVSGESDRLRVVEAIRVGVTSYVIKPFTPELLTRRVREAMGGLGALQAAR